MVLDALGVTSVAAVVGGSMGGMSTLEWPLCTPTGYVKNVIPIATSAYHNAWGISWAEAQRQCLYADPLYDNGFYTPTPSKQPANGLAAARMVAMLTYRSGPSFEDRFGRKSAEPKHPDSVSPKSLIAISGRRLDYVERKRPVFSAQSYLQYQGEKFVHRFDANCYIHLTRKIDHHDVTRDRISHPIHGTDTVELTQALSTVFSKIPPRALVIGIESDVLFRPEQQRILANALPDASLEILKSSEGHDGFLLEFEILDRLFQRHLRERCSWIYDGLPLESQGPVAAKKDSLFGEVESAW